uniref:Uncharacterized protein n=1 Tax=Caenorhabditis tropicalis TaxID=1561998 RepID=A0A1I7URS6_9PELO
MFNQTVNNTSTFNEIHPIWKKVILINGISGLMGCAPSGTLRQAIVQSFIMIPDLSLFTSLSCSTSPF